MCLFRLAGCAIEVSVAHSPTLLPCRNLTGRVRGAPGGDVAGVNLSYRLQNHCTYDVFLHVTEPRTIQLLSPAIVRSTSHNLVAVLDIYKLSRSAYVRQLQWRYCDN